MKEFELKELHHGSLVYNIQDKSSWLITEVDEPNKRVLIYPIDTGSDSTGWMTFHNLTERFELLVEDLYEDVE